MTNRRQGRWSAVNALMRPYRLKVAGLSAVSAAGGVAEAAFLVLVTQAALALAGGNAEYAITGLDLSIRASLTVSGGLIAFRLIAALAGVSLSARITSSVIADLRTRLSRSFLLSSWPTKQSEPAGQLQQLLVSYSQEATHTVNAATAAIVAALSLVALIGVAITVNAMASLLMVLVLGAIAVVLLPLRRMISHFARSALDNEIEFAHDVADLSMMGIEIETCGVRDEVTAHLSDLIQTNRALLRRVDTLKLSTAPLYVSLAYGVVVLGMVLVAATDAGQLGWMGAVMLIVLRSLAHGQQMQVSSAVVAERAPLLDSLNATVARYLASPAVEGSVQIEHLGTIEVKDVCFSYTPDEAVLSHLSFTISAGEVIGIIGPSGGGKTTLLQLLVGLREPDSGSIMVGGRELVSVDRRSWTSLVGFVPQDTALMSGTLEDNVRFFRDVDGDEVRRAVEAAHLTAEALSMPEGLATRVGSRGVQLSGGQRQRVAIARALATYPRMLVLDEPTAALDAGAELHIRDTLARLGDEVAVVIVAHRISTLEECDRIMVLEDGRISSFDRPHVLARDNDFYREALTAGGLT